VLDRLRLVLVQAATEKGTPVTVSLGAATFERPPLSVDEMLRAADRMLYDVKQNGRNGVRHDRVA
jgi:diguanylate cyclase (GGDEF)-like protein